MPALGVAMAPADNRPQGGSNLPQLREGQVFAAEGNARSNDVQALLTARQPAACKPGGDPVAARKEQGMRVPPLPRARECRSMRTQHKVVVGVTWGTLPADLQMRWQRIACDAL